MLSSWEWLKSRPWGNKDNYITALQSVLGMNIVLAVAVYLYSSVVISQGETTATTLIVIAIIGCKNVLKLSRPVLGDASKKAVINILATLVAGAVSLVFLQLGNVLAPYIIAQVLSAVFFVYFVTEFLDLDDAFPMLFCSTLVSTTLIALAAGTMQNAITRTANSTLGIIFAVVVVMVLVVFLFPRTGSIQAVKTLKSMLKEQVKLNNTMWHSASIHRVADNREEEYPYAFAPDARTPAPQAADDSNKAIPDSFLIIVSSVGKLSDHLKTSLNEGYVPLIKGWYWTRGLHLPCWPCRCLGPGLPRDEMKRLASAIFSAAQLQTEMAALLKGLSDTDSKALARLRAVYRRKGDSAESPTVFAEIAAASTTALSDIADSFPDGMTCVKELCDSKSLRSLQELIAEVRQRETTLWDRMKAEDSVRALRPWTWARPFLGGKKQLIFEPGKAGFTHVTRFAGFHMNLTRLLDTILDIHSLNNAVLQQLPWSDLPASS